MRRVINLNNDWAFIQQDAGLPEVMPTDWQTVSLPHTWNAIDGHDGNGGYDKGILPFLVKVLADVVLV